MFAPVSAFKTDLNLTSLFLISVLLFIVSVEFPVTFIRLPYFTLLLFNLFVYVAGSSDIIVRFAAFTSIKLLSTELFSISKLSPNFDVAPLRLIRLAVLKLFFISKPYALNVPPFATTSGLLSSTMLLFIDTSEN